jgi:hypothetical protein
MLLTHIGEVEAGLSVRRAVTEALGRGDLVVERSGAVAGGAARVTAVIVAGLAS